MEKLKFITAEKAAELVLCGKVQPNQKHGNELTSIYEATGSLRAFVRDVVDMDSLCEWMQSESVAGLKWAGAAGDSFNLVSATNELPAGSITVRQDSYNSRNRKGYFDVRQR
jgi:hypothetical protein